MQRSRMTRRDWSLLFALSLPWGCSFLFFKLLGAHLPPLTVAWARVALASAAMWLVLPALGVRPWAFAGRWRSFLWLGIFTNALPFTLFAWGTGRVPSGVAAIANALSPAFTVLIMAAVVGQERLSAPRLAGIGLGFLGLLVLMMPRLAGLGAGPDGLGLLACVAAAASYGVGAPVQQQLRGLPPLAVAAGQLAASTLVLTVPALLIDRPWTLPPPPASAWAALVGLSLFSTAFACALWFTLVRSAGPSNAMLVTYVIPVVALGMGALVLGEAVTLTALAGMAIIALGLALLDGRLRWPGRTIDPSRVRP